MDKAGGLMLYARLLEQSLEETNGNDGDAKVDFGALTALPGGLDDMYTTNFGRAFPAGDGGAAWAAARPLVEAVVASRELLPVAVLGAAERAVLPAVSLLLPVRRIDGIDRVGVLHKSVKDWLTDAGRAEGFAVEAPPGDDDLVVYRRSFGSLATSIAGYYGALERNCSEIDRSIRLTASATCVAEPLGSTPPKASTPRREALSPAPIRP